MTSEVRCFSLILQEVEIFNFLGGSCRIGPTACQIMCEKPQRVLVVGLWLWMKDVQIFNPSGDLLVNIALYEYRLSYFLIMTTWV